MQITITIEDDVIDTLCTAWNYSEGDKGDFVKGQVISWVKDFYRGQKATQDAEQARQLSLENTANVQIC
jgi:hypothetical protein